MFVEGEVRIGATGTSNGLVLVSGPNSILSAHGDALGGMRIGSGRTRGNMLIISNGAKVFTSNGGTIGGNGQSGFQHGHCRWRRLGVVPIAGGSTGNVNIAIGTNSGGSTNNALIVYDGGVVSVGGTIQLGNSTPGSFSNTFQMGGTGLISTGGASRLRFPSTCNYGEVTITNAYFSTGFLALDGGATNTVRILAGGTYVLEPGIETNALDMTGGFCNSLEINGGTVDASAGCDLYHFVATGTNNTLALQAAANC